MSGQSFDLVLLVIYFAYGLAFFGMGLTLALESERSPSLAETHFLPLLAAFGLIHGAHEWLEAFLLQSVSQGTQLPAWLIWLRTRNIGSIFFSLMLFGHLNVACTQLKSGHIHIFWLGNAGHLRDWDPGIFCFYLPHRYNIIRKHSRYFDPLFVGGSRCTSCRLRPAS